MMLDDRDSSNEISPLNRIKDEYPFFIIEIAGEPLLHACLQQPLRKATHHRKLSKTTDSM